MPARVKRVIVASPPSDKVTAGKIRCRSESRNASKRPASKLSISRKPVTPGGAAMSVPSRPRNGSQCNCIANSICNMIANQNGAIRSEQAVDQQKAGDTRRGGDVSAEPPAQRQPVQLHRKQHLQHDRKPERRDPIGASCRSAESR